MRLRSAVAALSQVVKPTPAGDRRVVEVTAPLLSLDLLADEEGVASVIGRSEGSLQLEDMGPDEPGLVWFEVRLRDERCAWALRSRQLC